MSEKYVAFSKYLNFKHHDFATGYRIHLIFLLRQYQWVDEKGKKSRLSAPQYIDYIMTYVQKSINDESTFPTKHGEFYGKVY